MNPIDIKVITTPGCQNCKRFKDYWHSIETDWPDVTFTEIDATSEVGQSLVQKYMIFSSPSIIINDELFATGGFSEEKFLKKLKDIS